MDRLKELVHVLEEAVKDVVAELEAVAPAPPVAPEAPAPVDNPPQPAADVPVQPNVV